MACRPLRLIAAGLAALLPALAAATPWTIDAEAGGFSAYRLDNGFRLILAPFPAAATTRVELLVKVGSKHEGYGESGMAHLLEHMLFKGAGRRPDLKRELTALGASWNGTTNTDRTNYFATVSADPERVDALLRLEADRFLRPTFSAEDLTSEMSVVRNELERNDNDPRSLLGRALQRQSFAWHGYGRSTIGARSDIEQAPFAALQAFHRRHYRPDNAVLIVSGKFDRQRILDLAGELFAAAANPAEPRPATWTREDAERPRQRAELHRESGSTLARAAWLLPGGSDRQTLAIDLAMPALCADSWGSLRKQLVDEQRLALGVSCGVDRRPDYALLVASAGAGRDGDAAALAAGLRAGVLAFAAQGIAEDQLQRLRRNQLQRFDRTRLSHEATAARLSAAEVAGDWRLFLRERDVIAALTLAEVNDALRRWLDGVAPAEALLHHAPATRQPVPPAPPAAGTLVAGGNWPAVAVGIDPLPETPAQLATATQTIDLGDPTAQASLIARRTQNGLAQLVVANDYGNAEALRGRQAACSLAGTLLAEGSAEMDRDRLRHELEALEANARFSLSLGRITLQAPPDKLAAALDLALAVRLAPALPAAAFERHKAAAVASLEAALQHPTLIAASEAEQRFDNFPADHPLRPRPLADQLRELQAVTLADVRRCIADFAGRSTLRIAAVGELDEDDVRGFWQALQTLPPSAVLYRRIVPPAAPATADSREIVVAMPQRPNGDILGLTQLPVRVDDPDYPALELAVRLLGGDAASRFRLRLREREGLAYSVGASLAGNAFAARSRLSISASVASDQAERARDMLREELAKALADGFSEAEVAAGIAVWQGQRRQALQFEPAYVERLALAQLNGNGYARDIERDARIAQLTGADVNAALRRYLGNTSIVWAIGKGR